jgi:predicted aspartyl protease
MRRIVASVKIDNVSDASKSLRCDALVDTGTSFMVLPRRLERSTGMA